VRGRRSDGQHAHAGQWGRCWLLGCLPGRGGLALGAAKSSFFVIDMIMNQEEAKREA